MWKKRFLTLFAVGATALCMTGCETLEDKARAKPEEISPFLQHSELLIAQKNTFPFHYFYLKKDAGKYKKIYVAPVNMEYLRTNKNWASVDEKVAKQLGSDLKQIAFFMQQCYKEEFARYTEDNLEVVGSPDGEGTLILESALISIVPSKSELIILGTAGNLLLPGIGVVANMAGAGSVTIECMIKDAKTGEIIAMYANTETDQHAVLNIAGMKWYTSAQNNIRKQADYTARIFAGQDYSKLRRKLITFIEL